MQINEAVQKAKAWVIDLYADEQIHQVGLEEVRYLEAKQQWVVTIGFSRQWDFSASVAAAFAKAGVGRSYKVVTISDATGEMISLTDRQLSAA